MLTVNKLKTLMKSDPGDIEAEETNQGPRPVFEHAENHKKHLSDLAQEWMMNPKNTQAREDMANHQAMDPQTRERMLQRLAQKTEVRVNPATKNREFLLHRGTSSEEKKDAVTDGHVYHPTASSWSPNYHVAHSFAAENLSHERAAEGGDRSNIINQSHKNVISAWVPEHHIATMPSMHLTQEQRQENPMVDEHEVIVRPHHLSPVAADKPHPAAVLSSGSKENPFALKKAETAPYKTPVPPKEPAADNKPGPVTIAHLKAQGLYGTPAVPQTKEPARPFQFTGHPIEPNTVQVDQPPEAVVAAEQQAHKEGEDRRQKENIRKRKNMDMVKEPSPTGLAMDSGSNFVPDAIYAATQQKPDIQRKLKNGLVYSVVTTPDKSKTYHFLRAWPAQDKKDPYPAPPLTVAAIELTHTPEGHQITGSYNKFEDQRNSPVLLKYAAKHHKVKKLLVPELDAEIHGIDTFKNHNPDVINGLRPTIAAESAPGGVSDSAVISNRDRTKKAIVKEPLSFRSINSASRNRFESPDYAKANEHWKDPTFNTSHREAAYDKMARDFFGMGSFVPKTTAFKHPKTGNINSAQEWKNNIANRGEQNDFVWNMEKNLGTPTVQKLYLMDTILGNTDRHGQNLIFSKDGQLHLIDHGLTFDIPNTKKNVDNNYVGASAHSNKLGNSNAMHKETKEWIESLDPQHMRNKLRESGVPEELADRVVYRLEKLKAQVAKHPRSALHNYIGTLLRTGQRRKPEEEPGYKAPVAEEAPIVPGAGVYVAGTPSPSVAKMYEAAKKKV